MLQHARLGEKMTPGLSVWVTGMMVVPLIVIGKSEERFAAKGSKHEFYFGHADDM